MAATSASTGLRPRLDERVAPGDGLNTAGLDPTPIAFRVYPVPVGNSHAAGT